jgi:hypothetical protein
LGHVEAQLLVGVLRVVDVGIELVEARLTLGDATTGGTLALTAGMAAQAVAFLERAKWLLTILAHRVHKLVFDL